MAVDGCQQGCPEVVDDRRVTRSLLDVSFQGIEDGYEVSGSLKAERVDRSFQLHHVLDRPGVVLGAGGPCDFRCSQ